MNKAKFTVCLTASRRPELLSRTLTSFYERLLGSVDIKDVYVNIDPIFGSYNDHHRVIHIVKHFFPNAVIYEPASPNFTAAVKRLWAHAHTYPVLHLEDDWILSEDICPRTLLNLLKNNTKAISFLSEEHGEKGNNSFSMRYIKRKMLGITYRRTTESLFNTSPGVFEARFLRKVSSLMDTSLDPEKQMRQGGGNSLLYDYLQQFKCAFYKSTDLGPVIVDIGRAWRDERNIDKVMKDGQSIWRKLT